MIDLMSLYTIKMTSYAARCGVMQLMPISPDTLRGVVSVVSFIDSALVYNVW